MWISAGTLDQIVKNFETISIEKQALFSTVLGLTADVGQLRGEKAEVEINAARLRADVEWMRLRINQLEVTNAELLNRVAGIRVPVAEVSSVGVPRHAKPDQFSNIFMDPVEVAQESAAPIGTDQIQAEDLLRARGLAVVR